MTDIQQILNEREKTHGDYSDVASISQKIKGILTSSKNWESMEDVKKESLEMISSKIARILSGDHNEMDSWVDISGYSELIYRKIQRIKNE